MQGMVSRTLSNGRTNLTKYHASIVRNFCERVVHWGSKFRSKERILYLSSGLQRTQLFNLDTLSGSSYSKCRVRANLDWNLLDGAAHHNLNIGNPFYGQLNTGIPALCKRLREILRMNRFLSSTIPLLFHMYLCWTAAV